MHLACGDVYQWYVVFEGGMSWFYMQVHIVLIENIHPQADTLSGRCWADTALGASLAPMIRDDIWNLLMEF